jgi:hypothetical protein
MHYLLIIARSKGFRPQSGGIMNRFVLVTCLAMISSLSLADRINAQTPNNGNYGGNYPAQYYQWYWHHHNQSQQSAEERNWNWAQRQVFPNAIYDYTGWAMPGSVYNNPYSLYGPAATVPTLYYPQYMVGKYDVRVVPHSAPNYYAPPQYEYIPVPRR